MVAVELAAFVFALSSSGATGFAFLENASLLQSHLLQSQERQSFVVSAKGGVDKEDCVGMEDPEFWAKKTKLQKLLDSTKGVVTIKDGNVNVEKVPFMPCGEDTYKEWCEGKEQNPDCSNMKDVNIPRKTLTRLCAKTVGIDMTDEGPPLVKTLKEVLQLLEVTKIQVTGLAGRNRNTGKMVAKTEAKVRENGWLDLAKARGQKLEDQLGVTADRAISEIGKPAAKIKIKASNSAHDLKHFESPTTRKDCIKEICTELTVNLQGLVSIYEEKKGLWIDEADLWRARYEEIKVQWMEADERTNEVEEILRICQGNAVNAKQFEIVTMQRDSLKWKLALAVKKCDEEKETVREECKDKIREAEETKKQKIETMVKAWEKERSELEKTREEYKEKETAIVLQHKLIKATHLKVKTEKDRLTALVLEKDTEMQEVSKKDKFTDTKILFQRDVLLKYRGQLRELQEEYDDYVEIKEKELRMATVLKEKELVELREECDEEKSKWTNTVSAYLLEKTTAEEKIITLQKKERLLIAAVKTCEDDVEDCEDEKEKCKKKVKDCPPTPPTPPDEGDDEDGDNGEGGDNEGGDEGGEGDDEGADDEGGGEDATPAPPTPGPPKEEDIVKPPSGKKACHVGGGWIYCDTDGDCPANTKDALTCRLYGHRYTSCHKVCDCVEVDNNRAGNSKGLRYTQTSKDPSRKTFKKFLRKDGINMKECMPALKTSTFEMPEPEISGSKTNQMYRKTMKRRSKTQRQRCTEVINGFIVHVDC